MNYSKIGRRAMVALFALVCGLSLATSASASIVYQQVNGPPPPSNFFWVLDDIGWYWTPATDVALTGVETQLATASNINNNWTFTTTLFTDRPANGGVALGSFNWNGTAFVDGPWLGGAFASPIDLTGGTQYFVGMSGWAQAVVGPPTAPTGGAGVNWIDPPGGGVENLGAGSSWGSNDGSFSTQFSPNGLGSTDQPVIRFLTVPEPSSIAMIALCVVALGFAIRRRR